jgi:hypothetical protein
MDLNFRDPKLNKEKFINLVLFNRDKRHFLLKNCHLICKNLNSALPEKYKCCNPVGLVKGQTFLATLSWKLQ